MSGPYIQVDETPIKYLDPGNGKTGQGYFWVAHRPGEDVLFEGTRPGKRNVCRNSFRSISGTIQCDGYSAYDRFARQRASEGKAVLLAGCWAHTRRAFYEALDHAPKEAGWILIQIGHLYAIERRLRKQRAGRALRDAYRSSQSQPICARIRQILQRWHITRRFLPQSTMGKAIHYALDQWESLQLYLRDPLIEIDNNLVENAIRPTALGKNYEQSGIRQSFVECGEKKFACLLCGGRVNAGEVLRASGSPARHGFVFISPQMGLPSNGG